MLSVAACQEVVFQDLSEEEEMDEEEEERAAMETGGTPMGCSAHSTFAHSGLNDTGLTPRLLQFAERISNDIQRYFGQKNEEADSHFCSIYEDCCSPRLSGQVLYYADLVRISQCREPEEDDGFPDPSILPVQLEWKLWRSFCSKGEAEKLGPLAELFEYGLCRYLKPPAFSDNRKLRVDRKYSHVVPMHSRKFPQSFWKEPSLPSICILSGNPPDFSDLLANWTSETS